MRQSELAILLQPTLNPMARSLYLALRSAVDYKTGIACIAYSRLIDLIRYEPTAKSKSEPITPSVKQIRVWLAALEERGLIQKHKDGNAAKGESASWLLVEMMKGTKQGHMESQQNQGLQANQGHISGAQEGHKKGTSEGHIETQENQGLQPHQGHIQNTHQGHISYISNKRNIYMEPQQNVAVGEHATFLSATDLTLDGQFLLAARTVGLTIPQDEIQLVLIDFQNHKNNRTKYQALADWLADWRQWCAKTKLYHSRSLTNANQHHANNPKPYGKQSASASVFAFAKAAADKLANGEG